MLFINGDNESGVGDRSTARGCWTVPASTASSPAGRASTRRNPSEPVAESLACDRTIVSNDSASASSAARCASLSRMQAITQHATERENDLGHIAFMSDAKQ
jgi:hypothetical protein